MFPLALMFLCMLLLYIAGRPTLLRTGSLLALLVTRRLILRALGVFHPVFCKSLVLAGLLCLTGLMDLAKLAAAFVFPFVLSRIFVFIH